MKADKNKKTILFVDDESALVKMNMIYLQRHGYNVRGTIYGSEALNWFRMTPGQFDLVITDISMPELSGEDIICSIRKIKPEIPIIVLSGTIGLNSRNESENIICLDKPVEPSILLSSIRKLLE